MDDWNLYDDGWFGGSDTDLTDTGTDYNMSDWWNSQNDLSNYNFNDTSNYDGYNDYTYGGPSATGGNDGSGFNYGGLMNAGLMAGAGYLNSMAQGKQSAEQLKLQEQLNEQLYRAKLAEDEKYYQAHGKQLSDAYQKYKGFYRDPSKAENNPTNIFGLLTPKPTSGPLANGW